MNWYWKLRREVINTFTEGFLPCKIGQVYRCRCSLEKGVCIGYVRTDTKVYINTYRGRMTGRMLWYHSGKIKSVGTLGQNRQIGTSYVRYIPDLSR